MPRGGTSGQRYVIDDEWKAALRLRLKEMGWLQVELARRLGVTPGAITYLFKDAMTSTLKPKIAKLVNWPDEYTEPPAAGANELAELIALYQALNAEDRVRLIERANTLADRDGGPRRR